MYFLDIFLDIWLIYGLYMGIYGYIWVYIYIYLEIIKFNVFSKNEIGHEMAKNSQKPIKTYEKPWFCIYKLGPPGPEMRNFEMPPYRGHDRVI